MIAASFLARALRDVCGRIASRHLHAIVLLCAATAASAHIGSPNVFYEGAAGPYPVRIVIRPPGVIPGLAEIFVRVNTGGVDRVSALPIRWNTGRQGAPPPDEARPVRGETNLFATELWFMQGGAQSVAVQVDGKSGSGQVIVPVNAIATRVLGMPRHLGQILAALACLLVILAVGIVGAAARDSVLAAGDLPSNKRKWFARAMKAISAGTIAGLLWAGQQWWNAEARSYRNNRLYQPTEARATVALSNDVTLLHLHAALDPGHRTGPLVPDHGKLMHLFLVREPALDVFAHLHPAKVSWQSFQTVLPALPAGRYRAYADITYETGFAETLTTSFLLSGDTRLPPTTSLLDPDDSWSLPGAGIVDTNTAPPVEPDHDFRQNHPSSPALLSVEGRTEKQAQRLSGSGVQSAKFDSENSLQVSAASPRYRVEWRSETPLLVDREIRLRFAVRTSDGSPATVQPYMGMAGHLILRRDDGSVFTHLHPSGSFSMAAQQLFQLRAEGKAPLRIAAANSDPICQLPAVWAGEAIAGDLSFTYAFPQAGRYRLWLQAKVDGEILTGIFDADVVAR